MGQNQASPVMMAIAVVVLLGILGGIGWMFLKPPPANQSRPPAFIDPATGRPRGAQAPGAPGGPGGGASSGMGPSPIGQSSGFRPGGPTGAPVGPGGPGGYPGQR